MSINLTMIGQAISFALFVWFCMKFVWPPLMAVMRERQQAILDGLEKAQKAERQLEEANSEAAGELEQAKQEAAEILNQARSRANQIVEDAKAEAVEAAKRIEKEAEAKIDQEVSRAREELRARVSDLAVEGAEKILESSVDRARHQQMLDSLAQRL